MLEINVMMFLDLYANVRPLYGIVVEKCVHRDTHTQTKPKKYLHS